MSNNSMDVRAKHGRCFVCQLARCFAPRHLSRSAFLEKKPNGKIALWKTKTLRVKSNSCEVKRRAEDNDTPNKSLDVRAKQPLFKNLRGYLRLVRRRFCPTSSQPLDAS